METYLNDSRRNRSKTVAILFAILAIAAAAPAAAATVQSPLHFPVRQDRAVRRAAEAGESLLDLDVRALGELRQVARGQSIRLEAFPFAPGATGDLLLERFEVATPDARVLVQTAHGTDTLPMPAVAHFRGRLEGDAESRVYVGVQAGFLVAIARTSAGVVYVGPEDAAAGPVQHVLRRADSPLNDEYVPTSWRCDADDLPLIPLGDAGRIGEPSLRPASAISTEATTSQKEATVSIETDQELLAKYSGNVSAMTAYITTLFGQVNVIYQRDLAVHLTLNLIQAWTTTDPYSATDTRTQLNEVGDWWHANRPKGSYPRTTVHYMSGKPVSGGIAWIDVLCMGDFSQSGHWGGAYGVTQVNAAYPSSPWDLLAVAHELGHNFGSPHTHCFSPPIDMCYNAEPGCYSGPIVNPGPLGGTIMSYCHLLSGGYGNIDLRFHERCINEQMLPEINAVSCLTTIPDPTTAAANFYSVAPCRAVDTRTAAGPYGAPALAANTSRTFPIGGRCGVPVTAKAVALNLTITEPTGTGDLRAYPANAAMPLVSAINYRAGQTRANTVQIGLDSTGALAIRCDLTSGNVQVIMDLFGYFQ